MTRDQQERYRQRQRTWRRARRARETPEEHRRRLDRQNAYWANLAPEEKMRQLARKRARERWARPIVKAGGVAAGVAAAGGAARACAVPGLRQMLACRPSVLARTPYLRWCRVVHAAALADGWREVDADRLFGELVARRVYDPRVQVLTTTRDQRLLELQDRWAKQRREWEKPPDTPRRAYKRRYIAARRAAARAAAAGQ